MDVFSRTDDSDRARRAATAPSCRLPRFDCAVVRSTRSLETIPPAFHSDEFLTYSPLFAFVIGARDDFERRAFSIA
jgi:hypothetical protein